jgi:YMGG-like Gly-zipper
MKENDRKIIIATGIALLMVVAGWSSAFAQQSISSSLGLIPYPSKGQSPAVQNQDEGTCYSWAKQQTGIDPVAVANTPPPPSGPAVGGGERLKGAARGAVGGAAIGAVAGDSSDGAAIGAVAGTMAGGRKARQNKQAESQQAQDAKAGTIAYFNKAFAACMEGKGYIVK